MLARNKNSGMGAWVGGACPLLEYVRRLPSDDAVKAGRFLRARFNAVKPRCIPSPLFRIVPIDRSDS
eukprot:2990178-Pyramimonas_sp.AAC.1